MDHSVDYNPKLIKRVRNRRDLNVEERIAIYKKKEFLFNVDYEGLDNILFKLIDKENVAQKTKIKYDNASTDVAAVSTPETRNDVVDQLINGRYNLRSRQIRTSREENTEEGGRRTRRNNCI